MLSIRLRILLMTLSIASALGAAVSSARAADDKVPLAVCADGKTQYVPADRLKRDDKGHNGACRGHGGVKSWADSSPVRSRGTSQSEYR